MFSNIIKDYDFETHVPSDIATSESSLEITFDDLKSIEFSDLYSGLSLKGQQKKLSTRVVVKY